MRTRLLALALLSALSSVAFSAQPEAFMLNSATHRPLNTILDLSGVTLTLGPVAGNVAFGANETVAGTLGVTGALSGSSAAFNGNETVGGTLVVTGAVTGATFSGNGAAVTNLTPANLTGSTAYGRNLLTLADGTAAIAAFGKTTLAGYGITDAQPLDSDLTAVAALATTAYGRNLLTLADGTAAITAFGKTTLAGYGITDAQPLDSDLTAIAALATTAYGRNLLTLADGTAAITAFGKTTLAGYGITDAQPLDSDLTAVAALTTTAYGRNLLTLADGTAAITAFGKTTLAGYGITDAQPLDSDLTAVAALTTTAYGRNLLTLADGTAAITAFGKTTLAGYGITDAQPLDADLTAIAALTTTSYGRALLTVADGSAAIAAFGKTTLAGYGITNGAATTTVNTFSQPQTLPVRDSGGQVFDARVYGAVGDNSTDDTAAINSALSAAAGKTVYLAAATYKILGDLIVPANTVFAGANLQQTTLHVPSSAAQTLGVIRMGQGATVRDIAISFDQPDTTVAASLTQYKPAIYAQGKAGYYVKDVAIVNAWDGIDMRGNAGQAVLNNILLSAYNVGINLDGALDTVRINNLHFWPFNLTANQLTIFAAQAIGIKAGRCDGLYISNSLFIYAGMSLYSSAAQTAGVSGATYTSVGGIPWVFIDETDFDTNAVLSMSAGEVQASNCAFTQNATTAHGIVQSGGSLRVSNAWFNAPSGVPMQVSGSSLALVSQSRFSQGTQDVPAIASTSAGNALTVTSSAFARTAANYTTPMISVTAGRATITANRASDLGGFTGNFVAVTSDDYHVIANNSAPGWTFSLPASPSIMQVFGNATGGTNQNGPLLAGSVIANSVTAGGVTASGTVSAATVSGTTTVTSPLFNATSTGGNAAPSKLTRTQSTNDIGCYLGYYGGASGTTLRGLFGYGHTGTGADSIFTGEDADSFNIRATGKLILGGGGDFIGAKLDANTTSGETRLLLYDITAGTVKRVSIGATDSGGTGYKVLRVPN